MIWVFPFLCSLLGAVSLWCGQPKLLSHLALFGLHPPFPNSKNQVLKLFLRARPGARHGARAPKRGPAPANAGFFQAALGPGGPGGGGGRGPGPPARGPKGFAAGFGAVCGTWSPGGRGFFGHDSQEAPPPKVVILSDFPWLPLPEC